MKELKKRQQFSQDFINEAVLLITKQGYTFSQAVEALSIRENYIRRWKKIFLMTSKNLVAFPLMSEMN